MRIPILFTVFFCAAFWAACDTKVKNQDNCGDGFLDPGEACDGPDFGQATCLDHGFYQGSLACRSDCTLDLSGCSESCGDGVIQTAHEQCEDQDFQDVTCVSLGYSSGALACSPTCQRDLSGCVSQCGDGVVNTGQDCDDGGTDDGDGCSASCAQEVGWSCTGSPSTCDEVCGDAEIVGDEVCDDGVNDGAYGGCMPSCRERAPHCGDGVIDTSDGEVCDGDALGGVTCGTLGYYAGTTACSTDCGSVLEDACLGKALDATRYGGINNDALSSLAVDSAGNVVMTGSFSLSTDFGDGLVSGNGTNDNIFVAKVGPSGALAWFRSYGNFEASRGLDVAVDSQNNVYVTGYFSSTLTFGDAGSRTAVGTRDGFLLKLDPDGNPLWVRRFGGPGINQGNGVAIASSGKAYITGAVSGGNQNILFDGWVTAESGAGGTDIFVVSYTSAGDFDHSELYGTSLDEAGTGIAMDGSDQPTIIGTYRGAISFGGIPLANAGDTDVFILRMDPVLDTPFWVKRIASAGADTATRVSVTADGSVAVAAAVNAQAECGATQVIPAGSQDGLAARLDALGNFLWCRPLGATGWENVFSLVLDPSGGVFMAGSFAGQATIGPFVLASAGLHDVFLVRLDAQGDPVWARRFGGPTAESAYALGAGPGGMVLGGGFAGTLDFGTGELAVSGTNGNADVYLAWFRP
ncbi:hypothetical protein KJ612_13270 [Myxococcota bacterium]|nr:hypothetical protein [Myxococcota bacterium]